MNNTAGDNGRRTSGTVTVNCFPCHFTAIVVDAFVMTSTRTDPFFASARAGEVADGRALVRKSDRRQCRLSLSALASFDF
jgi:hypothetical protein